MSRLSGITARTTIRRGLRITLVTPVIPALAANSLRDRRESHDDTQASPKD